MFAIRAGGRVSHEGGLNRIPSRFTGGISPEYPVVGIITNAREFRTDGPAS